VEEARKRKAFSPQVSITPERKSTPRSCERNDAIL